jgi:hypothetical protein
VALLIDEAQLVVQSGVGWLLANSAATAATITMAVRAIAFIVGEPDEGSL